MADDITVPERFRPPARAEGVPNYSSGRARWRSDYMATCQECEC